MTCDVVQGTRRGSPAFGVFCGFWTLTGWLYGLWAFSRRRRCRLLTRRSVGWSKRTSKLAAEAIGIASQISQARSCRMYRLSGAGRAPPKVLVGQCIRCSRFPLRGDVKIAEWATLDYSLRRLPSAAPAQPSPPREIACLSWRFSSGGPKRWERLLDTGQARFFRAELSEALQ